MKKIYLVATSFFFVVFGFSQSRYTVVQFNKKDVPGVIGEIPFVPSTVKEAIDKNFEKLGYKAHKAKDNFYVYSGVILKELDSMPHDIYLMVDKKSRQEKEVSQVIMLIGKGFDDFANDTADGNLINRTKIYINSLRDVAVAYDLELQITAQEEVIKKNVKKTDNLLEDSVSLQKKKKKLFDEIGQNSLEQASQKIDNERQSQILETLKSKRKLAN